MLEVQVVASTHTQQPASTILERRVGAQCLKQLIMFDDRQAGMNRSLSTHALSVRRRKPRLKCHEKFPFLREEKSHSKDSYTGQPQKINIYLPVTETMNKINYWLRWLKVSRLIAFCS